MGVVSSQLGGIWYIELSHASVGISTTNTPWLIIKKACELRKMTAGRVYCGIINNGVQYHFSGLVTENDKYANFKIYAYNDITIEVTNLNENWHYIITANTDERVEF